MPEHTCHWTGCNAPVPPKMWGCKRHWYLLPKSIRDRFWAAYRPGQEIDKNPSDEYIAAARAARDWIAGQTSRAVESPRQIGRTDAEFRMECEARQWIREGYFNAARVEDLMDRIAKRRGREAADALREEMRRQWLRRGEWLQAEESEA